MSNRIYPTVEDLLDEDVRDEPWHIVLDASEVQERPVDDLSDQNPIPSAD
jgi:hypothetical protein